MKHELKIRLAYFEAVLSGEKTFEIRDNSDRGFQKGDTLLLREFDQELSSSMLSECYTGRSIEKVVSYVSNYEQKPGYVVLSFKAPNSEANELRICLDAALLEIEDLNQDIEKLRSHGQIVPKIWQLVPVDPTVEMTINAIKKAKIKYLGHGGYEAIYRAMLAAAPKAEGGAA